MENFDFGGGATEISQLISKDPPPPPPQPPPQDTPEKKLDESQMMEFTSSVSDLMPIPQSSGADSGVYTAVTSGRVTGIAAPNEPQQKKKSPNPFNLTDDQFSALIAGVVAVVVFSTAVQSKLAGLVPNFNSGGFNAAAANVLVVAIVYFFAYRFIKNR